MDSRIMYIERKEHEPDLGMVPLSGQAWIGRVEFSKTGKTIYYKGKSFQRLRGFKANYVDSENGEQYWISGCKKDGSDRLYGERTPIEIDDDIREEYWTKIRNLPENKNIKVINGK